MISQSKLINSVFSYIERIYLCEPGRYRNCIGGKETLYASCFALMIYHYLDRLKEINKQCLDQWGTYILEHQDSKSGYFIGPEIYSGKLISDAHSRDHLCEHLTAHVLPAIDILGRRPKYQLKFANKYLGRKSILVWLGQRDWSKAWLEGNNLLFAGQFLLYLYEKEGLPEAKESFEILMDWLDRYVDSRTGLWGTDGYCDKYSAIYGAYHQLLLYYYSRRPLKYKENLIDSVLSIQHFDGGFSRWWGGGTCEDADGIDILVNISKMTTYREKDIIIALKKAAVAILRKMTSEGGFEYKRNEEFIHMGMEYTYAPSGKANVFSTWFYILTLLIISEIVDLPCISGIDYHFNYTCSMGWHEKLNRTKNGYYRADLICKYPGIIIAELYFILQEMKGKHIILEKTYMMIKDIINIMNNLKRWLTTEK